MPPLKNKMHSSREHGNQEIVEVEVQWMPGNGCDRAQKNQRGVVNSAQKKRKKKSLLNPFIHFQLQNNALICLPSKIKVYLAKIIPVALKYQIFAMQNSPRGTPHRSDFQIAPVKYTTGVTG
jgi:hypothetical protein